MARAKLRRQISKELKNLGIPAKLYRGSKLKFHRGASGWYLRNMLLRLQLSKSGTVVGDCSAVNHVVKGFASSSFTVDRWHARGYIFRFPQLEFEDGTYSCGCETSPEPPKSQEEIETFLLKAYQTLHPGWPLSKDQEKLRDILLKGEHIVDERGVLLNTELSTMYI